MPCHIEHVFCLDNTFCLYDYVLFHTKYQSRPFFLFCVVFGSWSLTFMGQFKSGTGINFRPGLRKLLFTTGDIERELTDPCATSGLRHTSAATKYVT